MKSLMVKVAIITTVTAVLLPVGYSSERSKMTLKDHVSALLSAGRDSGRNRIEIIINKPCDSVRNAVLSPAIRAVWPSAKAKHKRQKEDAKGGCVIDSRWKYHGVMYELKTRALGGNQ